MEQTIRQTVSRLGEWLEEGGYHPEDLSPHAPVVHYDKRSHIPSAYSQDDVLKLLSLVDRANPVGKRNYAILLLIARLGLRSGDVVNLKYENINWEENRISLTQHKTGRPLTLDRLFLNSQPKHAPVIVLQALHRPDHTLFGLRAGRGRLNILYHLGAFVPGQQPESLDCAGFLRQMHAEAQRQIRPLRVVSDADKRFVDHHDALPVHNKFLTLTRKT